MNNENYVFISYAHKDSNVVFPCIEFMKKQGINIWYDEGIQAGSEWPEYIAEKIITCNRFVLFVSNSYLESQNCKRELNFAISQKKEILSVFVEDVSLSPGMEMQLGTYQSLFRNRFSNDYEFCKSFCNEVFLDPCRKYPVKRNTANTNTPSPSSVQSEYDALVEGLKQNGQNNGYNNNNNGQNVSNNNLPIKNRIVAALLFIFLGTFGAGYFYLGKPLRGILSVVFFWTYIPAWVGFIKGIILLCSSDESFAKKYKCRVN